MASATGMRLQRDQVAGIRRLGSSRLELLSVASPPPEWIAVTGPAGEEVARVVVPTGRCFGDLREARSQAWRPLQDDERQRVRQLVWDACQFVRQAQSALGTAAPGAQVLEARPALSGGFVLGLWAPDPLAPDLSTRLSMALGRLVVVEALSGPGAITGSTGLPQVVPSAAVAQAAERIAAGGSGAHPWRFPRLGSWVETPHGIGYVLQVRTRDATVLLRDQEGRQMTVPATLCRPISTGEA